MKIIIAVVGIFGLIVIVFGSCTLKAKLTQKYNDYHTIEEHSREMNEKYEVIEMEMPKAHPNLGDDITPHISSDGSIVFLSNNIKSYRVEIKNVFDKSRYPEINNSEQKLQDMEYQVFERTFGRIGFDSLNSLATENFRPVCFLRDKYHRRTYSLIGHGSPRYWEGFGFVDLVLKEGTLKLKMDMEEIVGSTNYFHYLLPDYKLFYNKNFNFYILRPNSAYIYLIKPR